MKAAPAWVLAGEGRPTAVEADGEWVGLAWWVGRVTQSDVAELVQSASRRGYSKVVWFHPDGRTFEALA